MLLVCKTCKRFPANDLILFYSTCIRPVIEYACQAFHDSLPKYLSDDLERLQKRAFRIIFPDQHYKEALRNTNTPSLYDRRQELTTKLFKDIVNNPEHKLTDLLPPLNNDNSHFCVKIGNLTCHFIKRTDLGTVLSLITLISFLNNVETVFTMNMLVFNLI